MNSEQLEKRLEASWEMKDEEIRIEKKRRQMTDGSAQTEWD